MKTLRNTTAAYGQHAAKSPVCCTNRYIASRITNVQCPPIALTNHGSVSVHHHTTTPLIFHCPAQACVDAGVQEAVEADGEAAFVQPDRASLPLLMLGGETAASADSTAPKGFLRVGMFLHQLTASVTADELQIDVLEWTPDSEEGGTELRCLKKQETLDAWVASQAAELATATRVRCVAKLDTLESATVTRNADATGGDELRVTLSAPPSVSTAVGAAGTYAVLAASDTLPAALPSSSSACAQRH